MSTFGRVIRQQAASLSKVLQPSAAKPAKLGNYTVSRAHYHLEIPGLPKVQSDPAIADAGAEQSSLAERVSSNHKKWFGLSALAALGSAGTGVTTGLVLGGVIIGVSTAGVGLLVGGAAILAAIGIGSGLKGYKVHKTQQENLQRQQEAQDWIDYRKDYFGNADSEETDWGEHIKISLEKHIYERLDPELPLPGGRVSFSTSSTPWHRYTTNLQSVSKCERSSLPEYKILRLAYAQGFLRLGCNESINSQSHWEETNKRLGEALDKMEHPYDMQAPEGVIVPRKKQPQPAKLEANYRPAWLEQFENSLHGEVKIPEFRVFVRDFEELAGKHYNPIYFDGQIDFDAPIRSEQLNDLLDKAIACAKPSADHSGPTYADVRKAIIFAYTYAFQNHKLAATDYFNTLSVLFDKLDQRCLLRES